MEIIVIGFSIIVLIITPILFFFGSSNEKKIDIAIRSRR